LAKEERAKVPGRGAAAPIARSGWNGGREVLLPQPCSGEASYQDRDRKAFVNSVDPGSAGFWRIEVSHTTLQRDVALKLLPATFLRDPERMARFQREGAGSIAMSSSYFTWTLT
jgi:hypothetical protein